MMTNMLGPEQGRAAVTSSTPVVSLKVVAKTYADSVAVEALSLDVSQGELVCLLGPSGCGKTTTLRMVAGLVEPTGGKVFIDGQDVTYLPAHERDIGMVFQAYALFPHMTVAQNIEYGLSNIGLARQMRAERVAEMLKRVELTHLSHRYPRELSGGQQQRVAVARALVLQPKVLLLDEPFSNLDAQLRIRLRDELRDLIRSFDITTLFVTHDQEEALTMADRIVVMNKGRVEQIGRSEDVYEAPASRFVAEFIGWCSLLEGRFERDGGFRTATGATLPFDDAPGSALLVVRPEQVKRASDAPECPSIKAVIESCSYHGSLCRLRVRVGEERLLMDAQFPGGSKPQAGEEIAIAIDPKQIHRLPH